MLLLLLLTAAPAAAASGAVVHPKGSNIAPEYWCSVAKLALEYSAHIQPWRAPHLEVFDALGLSTICGEARPEAVPHSASRASGIRMLTGVATGAVVVDGTKGSDQTGTGTEASPFQTIGKGVSAACAPAHTGAKTVIIRRGEYHLGGSTLLLGPSASGLTLMAAPGEHVVLTGGSAFSPKWQLVNGSSGAHVAAIPTGLIKPGVKASELLVLNSASAAGGSAVRRMMTARHPNASPYQYSSWQGSLKTASQWGQMSYDTVGNQSETVVSKRGLFDRLSARGPYFSGTHGGDVNAFEPVAGEKDGRGCAWADHVPYHVSQGIIQDCHQWWASERASDRPSEIVDPIACGSWSQPSDASLWCNIRWGNKGYVVRSRTGSNITFDRGGFQMAYGPATDCNNHYLEGMIEALDSPEEFYHDVTASKLYYFPNSTQIPPTVVLVTDESIIEVVGTQAAPVSDITIQGITFTGAAKTFLAPHQASTNGADWAAPRRAAVKIEGAHSISIQQCTFDTLGGNAVLWSDYVRNSSVLNSTFQWLGENGVLAFGTDQFGDVTSGEYPVNNTVEECLFREIGVYGKHSGAYAEFVAGAVKLANNIAFNGASVHP